MKPLLQTTGTARQLCALLIKAVSNTVTTLGILDLSYLDNDLPRRMRSLPAQLLLFHHFVPLEATLLEPQDDVV